MADDHMTDAEDMSVEMEPDEKDREYTTQFYLEAFEPYIRDCLSMSDLKTLILHYKRFDSDETKSLLEYSCAENRTSPDVFDEIMRVIRKKEEDHLKYTAFEKACAEMKHEKISLILSGCAHPTIEVHKKLIYKCGVHICNQLNTHSILPHLVSKDIISKIDCQRVQTAEQTHSNFDAAFRLLLLLPNRKINWYVLFMETLLEDKQEDLARKIDKELKKMVAEGANTYTSMVVDQLPSQRPTAKIMPYSGSGATNQGEFVGINIMSVEEEPEQMNDLDAPPPIPKRFDSLAEKDTITLVETTNLQEFNIKPVTPEKFQSAISGEETEHMLLYSRTREIDIPSSVIEKGNNMDETGLKQKCTDETEASGNYANVRSAAAAFDNDDDDEDDGDDSSDNLSSEYTSSEDEDFLGSAYDKLKLRNYQLELAENAVAGANTVICAATGSGKTWVALHIVKEHLACNEEGKKKVVFMARTSTLIKQQFDRLKKYLTIHQTKLITGENEESNNVRMFMEHYDILCLTPQILVNNLDTGAVSSLADFSLIILDECHHTVGNEPYNKLMRKYLLEKVARKRPDLPQIVGLTASIGVGKAHTDIEACDYIMGLCASLDVRVLSTVQRCVQDYNKEISHPEEEMIQMVKPRYDPCKGILLQAIEETEDKMAEITLLVPSMIEMMTKKCPRDKQSQEYSKWTVDIEKTALHTIEDREMARNVRACAIYLNVYCAALEVNSLLGPSDVITFLAKNHEKEEQNKDKLTTEEKDLLKKLRGVQMKLREHRSIENENVRMLCQILKGMMEKDPEECRAMVFVKARATCTALASYLKDFKDIGMDAHFLYGKDNRGGEDGMTESEQNETVEKFRNGDYKILVATSVGVEGIDVPDCNIVLNYNFQGNEITKIQMKGRSRKKEGHNVVMGDEKMLHKERINAYKLAMMQRAMTLFLKMDPKLAEKKITSHQGEIIAKYRMQKEIDRANLRRKSTDVEFEILCKRCKVLACRTSDIRLLQHQYFVIDKSFEDKITLKEHKKPIMYSGLHKKFKMYCKKCPMDWGIVSEHKGLLCRTLKLDSFILHNIQTGVSQSYKKWDDVPVAIPEVQLADLPRLLG